MGGVSNNVGGVNGMGITMQADNALYTGVSDANDLRHKTLTMEKNGTFEETQGNLTSDIQFGQFEVERVNDRKPHRGSCLLFWACGMSVMVLLALGAAAFALAVIFTGVVDTCRCATGT